MTKTFLAIVFTCLCVVVACGQTPPPTPQIPQNFNNFIATLPSASAVGAGDEMYILQGGVSKKILGTAITGTGTSTSTNLAKVDLLTQSAAITSTTILTPAASGMRQLCAYLEVTTTDGGGATLGLNGQWQDDNASQNVVLFSSIPVNITGANLGCTGIYSLGGFAIKYSTSIVGTIGTARYAIHLRLNNLE